MPYEDFIAYIEAVGTDRTILVSDTGQADNIRPVDAIRDVIRDLLESGYSEDAIHAMVGGNAAELLFKESDFA